MPEYTCPCCSCRNALHRRKPLVSSRSKHVLTSVLHTIPNCLTLPSSSDRAGHAELGIVFVVWRFSIRYIVPLQYHPHASVSSLLSGRELIVWSLDHGLTCGVRMPRHLDTTWNLYFMLHAKHQHSRERPAMARPCSQIPSR